MSRFRFVSRAAALPLLAFLLCLFPRVGGAPPHCAAENQVAESPRLSPLPLPKPMPLPPQDRVEDGRPTIELPVGPLQASVGDFLIITPKTSGVAVAWVVPNAGSLSRVPPEELSDAKKLIVACRRPGTQVVYALATNEKGQFSDQASLRIEVKGEPGPGPGPGPGPSPEPDPVFPDKRYKLAKFAYDTAYAKVPDGAARRNGAEALATSFEGAAARIAAGTVKDPETSLVELEASNVAALKAARIDRAHWDAWGTALQKEWHPLNVSGKMKTIEDFADAYREVALGLKSVR